MELPWTETTVHDQGKKDVIRWLQGNATLAFLTKHKMKGQLKSIAKSRKKGDAVAAYLDILETKEFSDEAGREAELAAELKVKASLKEEDEGVDKQGAGKKEEEAKEDAPVVHHWKRKIKKKGDKVNYPKKGDRVKIEYTGRLEDGKIFDQTYERKKKKHRAFVFKLGAGKVIDAWDQAVEKMSVGEEIELVVQPEGAYGEKGVPEAKIPPNAVLTFDVRLVEIL